MDIKDYEKEPNFGQFLKDCQLVSMVNDCNQMTTSEEDEKEMQIMRYLVRKGLQWALDNIKKD